MSKIIESRSRDDYILQLETKCEAEFPQKIEEIEEELEILRSLHSQLLTEKKDVLLEMEYLRGSFDTEFNLLVDLPGTVWAKVVQLCTATQNNSLWNACLASKNLKEKIIQNCPSVMQALIGRNAFAVLVRDYYLDRGDLLNCLNSKSEILEDCAATSWRYLKNTVAGSKVSFTDSKEIFCFMEQIRGKDNLWEIFVSKCFEFDGENLLTETEHKEFLGGLNKFLGEFGKFMFFLRTKDMEWMGTETNFFRDLFHTLRNIQIFQDYHGRSGPNHGVHEDEEKLNCRSLEPFFGIYPERGNQTFTKAVLSNCSVLSLNYYQLAFLCKLGAKQNLFENIQRLELNHITFNHPGYKTFLAADLSMFTNLNQVVLRGSEHYLLSLAFLTKFPRVREVFLHCVVHHPPPPNNPPPRATFEFVRKLTFEFRYGHPPRLDDIPEALPLLRYFCLRTEWCKTKLKNKLAEYKSSGVFDNYAIDLYDFYAEARPLSGSNIWQHMTTLRTLVVETTGSYLSWERYPAYNAMAQGAYTKRREIYSRDQENVIKMQETVFPR